MDELAEKLANYCERNFDLSKVSGYPYKSLSICIIDCVYSLRAKYEAVTKPVVQRYADEFMQHNLSFENDTVSNLVDNIGGIGTENFATQILKNAQRSGGVLKSEICLTLAKYLKAIGIETIKDFQSFPEQELLEMIIASVKGIGNAGVNYLFMLAGDSNRCKPDVHIHHCIKDAIGIDVSDEQCQTLFQKATQILNGKGFPNITVRDLDSTVWKYYESR